jgi:leader peptidase (prepilin peptidase) / N-methyltransferase
MMQLDWAAAHMWLAMSAPVVCLFVMGAAAQQTSLPDVRVANHAARFPKAVYALLIGLAVASAPSAFDALAILLLLATLGYLSVFDARTLSVPVAPIAVMTLLGLAFALRGGWLSAAEHAAAASAGWLSFVLIAEAYARIRGAEGLGSGDGLIAALIGSWLSFEGLAWAVTFGGAALLAWLFLNRSRVREPAAFAPGLAVGTLVIVLITSLGGAP